MNAFRSLSSVAAVTVLAVSAALSAAAGFDAGSPAPAEAAQGQGGKKDRGGDVTPAPAPDAQQPKDEQSEPGPPEQDKAKDKAKDTAKDTAGTLFDKVKGLFGSSKS